MSLLKAGFQTTPSMKNKLSLMPTSLARVALLTASALLAVSTMNAYAAAFTAGNIVVYRVGSGSGSGALTSASTAVYLDEYTTSGTFVQTINMPTATSGSQYALTASGTATSEGQMNNSVDGRYIITQGYGAAPGVASIAGTASATTPRVIARVDTFGNIDTSTALTDWTTGNNPRSAASVNGTSFYGGGAANDCYASALGNTTSTSLSTQNTRHIVIFNNQLYFSSSSGSYKGICTLGWAFRQRQDKPPHCFQALSAAPQVQAVMAFSCAISTERVPQRTLCMLLTMGKALPSIRIMAALGLLWGPLDRHLTNTPV